MKKIREFIQEVRYKKEGYLTIELSIIFTSIFFSLILVLFIGMVLYQEVRMQSLAVEASERGSVVYSARVSDMKTSEKTIEDFKIRDPYRNVPFLGGGNKSEYKSLINKYIQDDVGNRNVIRGNNLSNGNYTVIEDYIIAKRVKVNIHHTYLMPVGSIPEMFGHDGPFDVNTTVTSAIVDSPDFVRNIDIVMDVANKTEAFQNVQDGYNKIKEGINKVADFLK